MGCRWFVYGGPQIAREDLRNPYFMEMLGAFANLRKGAPLPLLTDSALDTW